MKKPESIESVIKRSSRAVCATAEKEVQIKSGQLSSVIRKLKKKGYMIIGTSYGKTPTKRLWYIKRGMVGL